MEGYQDDQGLENLLWEHLHLGLFSQKKEWLQVDEQNPPVPAGWLSWRGGQALAEVHSGRVHKQYA